MSCRECDQRVEYWRAQLLQERRRYEFLRDSSCVVEQWEPDSRYRIYLAGEPCEMLTDFDQKDGFAAADEAVDAAMNGGKPT